MKVEKSAGNKDGDQMKLDTETLRELIREAIREQEETSTQRSNDEIYDDIVGELARSKDNEGVRELMLNFLDALTNPQKIQEGCGMAHPPMMGGMNDDDHEVEMAISDLHKLEEYAPKVSQLAGQYSNLPGWVQAKITLAADYLGKVYHYLDGKHKQGM